MQTNEQNYQAFLDGNIEGFENLVREHKDPLIYFIRRYVKDIHQAEDLAQDVFVDVYVHKQRYDFRTSFRTYLFTIGHHKAVDYIRKYSRQVPMEEPMELSEEENNFVDQLIQEEEKQRVHRAIAQLKPDYQAALTLIDLNELSYQEAAKVLHKTVPQIKILIHRARKALKNKL